MSWLVSACICHPEALLGPLPWEAPRVQGTSSAKQNISTVSKSQVSQSREIYFSKNPQI